MSLRRACGGVISAVAITTGVLAATGAPPAAATPSDCPDLYVVAVPGTWETSREEPGQGMLAQVTRGLPGNVRTEFVSYAATAMPWEGEVYGRSKHEGVANARGLVANMAAKCAATKIALLGYSQGADAAGDLAAEIGTGLGVVPPDRVAAVGLLSDPRRSPTDALIGPPVSGRGAGGVRAGGFGWLTPKVRTFCAEGDLYCSLSNEDLAGRVAGFFTQASYPDPLQLGSYMLNVQSILSEALGPGSAAFMPTSDAPPSEQWVRQLQDFLASGVHQSYPRYVVDGNGATATSWLRNWLTDIANE
ncbi:cutinase family protein [Nocardia jejuensis]|uniref:cutinase family protein n=1 Tax=Nocardia jejuensis TaxID=328049 RepID=UPI000B0386A7|nr:cutinase family protein [Nocardia jejuensis]